jgi:DNA-directed RNA polymerase specialized sigma24 family protein
VLGLLPPSLERPREGRRDRTGLSGFRSLDPAAEADAAPNPDTAVREVDVAPSQPEKLAATDVEKRLRQLERAAQRARAAENDLAKARADVRRAFEEARTAGASISEIARRLGVSRQRVYALLD